MPKPKHSSVIAMALAAVLGTVGFFAATLPAKSAVSSAATVSLRSTPLGRILVNSQGRTLYLFAKDPAGKSACSAGCANVWRPLVDVTKPQRRDRDQGRASRQGKAQRRPDAGDLPRASALHLRSRYVCRPDEGRGSLGLRRQVVCGLGSGNGRSRHVDDDDDRDDHDDLDHDDDNDDDDRSASGQGRRRPLLRLHGQRLRHLLRRHGGRAVLGERPLRCPERHVPARADGLRHHVRHDRKRSDCSRPLVQLHGRHGICRGHSRHRNVRHERPQPAAICT